MDKAVLMVKFPLQIAPLGLLTSFLFAAFSSKYSALDSHNNIQLEQAARQTFQPMLGDPVFTMSRGVSDRLCGLF